MITVSLDYSQLNLPERKPVRQVGDKLYGKPPAVRVVRHD